MHNIALISPSKDAVSETFIKAHREQIKGNVHYLFGGLVPTESTNGKLARPLSNSRYSRLLPVFLYNRIVSSDSKNLERYLVKNKIDLVFAEYGTTGAAVLPVCKKLKLPLIVHFHGYDAYKAKALSALRERYKQLFEYAKYIIVVSRHMEKTIIELGAPVSKVVYNAYGASESFFKIKPDYSKGYFLSVGRFVEKKAPYLTLLAFYKMLKEFPEATMIMVGDGPLLAACKQLAAGLGFGNLIFTGAVAHEKVPDFYRNAFCFVQHSVIAEDGDAEGTPVAILEAGAAGLPVIATEHGGIPDVVMQNKTGFLVNEGNIEAMSDYMKLLYGDRVLVEKMGTNAKKHIQKYYQGGRQIERLNQLIACALNDSKK